MELQSATPDRKIAPRGMLAESLVRSACSCHGRIETYVFTTAKSVNLRLFAWLATLRAIALIVSIWTVRIG